MPNETLGGAPRHAGALGAGGLLAGRRVVVVGAGACGDGWGNGKAAAVAYARQGARVVAVDRDLSAARETQALIRESGGECEALEADVGQAAEVAAMIERAAAALGGIDVLHNNVGMAITGGPEETSEAAWEQMLRINQTSVFLSCKHVLPIMRRQGGGCIVNISSIAAVRWIGFAYSAYTASKAAIIAFTENLAAQCAADGIRANCILPGLMDTPMIHAPLTAAYGGDTAAMLEARHRQCPTGFMGDAWDVANASLFLASDMARYITGVSLRVDGGLSLRAATG
ncbi:SDR family NAD(P)-dependent oxidoreductase [Salinicola sp. JS01]|uniref:SDR family NAD(P)-dependent oxidoreductase n=1 Tax=Salinicola sp. JS01 TaxID=3050071 RepID=UPI00255BB587|nr:SDR family NAD(P)-dependent oxidoreductase [Salinicola sp. JS01]WIX33353.1 SDR family NAD(P)-dependent oxidoreductase [Salinicola sp. JS01]